MALDVSIKPVTKQGKACDWKVLLNLSYGPGGRELCLDVTQDSQCTCPLGSLLIMPMALGSRVERSPLATLRPNEPCLPGFWTAQADKTTHQLVFGTWGPEITFSL